MSRFRLSFLFLGIILKYTQAQALIIKTIDELHPLRVVLSERSLNRIAVENGGVKKIIAPEGLFDVQIDESTSQAFITVRECFDQSVAISVISDSGFVQDIEVSVEDKQTETIILKEPREKEELVDSYPRTIAIKVLTSLSKGELPTGYIASDIQPEDGMKVRNQLLCFIPMQAIEGPYDRIILYQMKNTGGIKTPVKEACFAGSNDLWIHLTVEILEPNGETILIIARGKK